MFQQHSMLVLQQLASQNRDDRLLPNQARSDDLNEQALKTKEELKSYISALDKQIAIYSGSDNAELLTLYLKKIKGEVLDLSNFNDVEFIFLLTEHHKLLSTLTKEQAKTVEGITCTFGGEVINRNINLKMAEHEFYVSCLTKQAGNDLESDLVASLDKYSNQIKEGKLDLSRSSFNEEGFWFLYAQHYELLSTHLEDRATSFSYISNAFEKEAKQRYEDLPSTSPSETFTQEMATTRL